MKTFRIENTASGLVMGVYPGDTAEDAIKAMRIDAGYPNGEAPEEVGDSDTLIATEVMTYTVRPLGQAAWAEGLTTLQDAARAAKDARNAGLGRVVIVDDVTGEVVDESSFPEAGAAQS